MNDMTNKRNAKPAKPETFTINITEEYVRECNQLDQEYRDKACRLYAEYSRKRISIDRRFSNKKASNTNNLFQPRNVEGNRPYKSYQTFCGKKGHRNHERITLVFAHL